MRPGRAVYYFVTTETNEPLPIEEAPEAPAPSDAPSAPVPPVAPGRLLGGFFAVIALLLLGTLGWNRFVNGSAGSATAPSQAALADPQALLRDTMTRYAGMKTFQADYIWRLGSGGGGGDHDHDGDGTPDHAGESHDDPGGPADGAAKSSGGGTSAKRTLLYVRPNKFRVISEAGGFRLTTVSDGVRLAEYASSPTLPGRTYPAPPTLASENSPLLQHPMFCATLLHRFFAGPEALARVVDLSRSPVRFGPDTRVGDAPCKTVLFTAQGVYGNTEIAISTRDGLIRRIRYDSAPLREEMQKRAKNETLPSMATEETYTRLDANEPLPDETFVTDLPPGVPVAPPRTPSPPPAAR